MTAQHILESVTNSTYNITSYSINFAYKQALGLEHAVNYIAFVGDQFLQANLDPKIDYVIGQIPDYKKVVTYVPAQKVIDNSVKFSLSRISNHKEAITGILTQATVDTFAGRFKLVFGDNPTASAVIRDAFKITTIHASISGNNTIGYTGTKYSEGTLWGAYSKVGCKAFMLTSYYVYDSYLATSSSGKEGFALAARGSNYVCEIPARYFNIDNRNKQIFEGQNKDLPKQSFSEYTQENFNWLQVGQASVEGVIKTASSDNIGEVSKKIGYSQYIREGVAFTDNMISSVSFGQFSIPFTAKDDVYSKCGKLLFMTATEVVSTYSATQKALPANAHLQRTFLFTVKFIMHLPKLLVNMASIVGVEFTGNVVNNLIVSYGVGTPTRVSQDASGLAIKNAPKAIDTIKEVYDSYINATPLSGEESFVSNSNEEL
ncbi:MAG: hypothetical protein N4A31_03825 [Rickettsiales bacterium]|jgi:hypothetical protein|nr:hypothetical protein [Rickettsiales bacterium]